MAVMAYFFHRPLWGGLIFVDAGILIVVLFPGFYLFLYRPMEKEMEERAQISGALQEQEKKYRLMMEAMHDPVYICSADYTVIYMNPAMIQRTGRNAVGEHCYSVIHNRIAPCPWCCERESSKGGVRGIRSNESQRRAFLQRGPSAPFSIWTGASTKW